MQKYFKHLMTISKHKWYVMMFCFKCGIYKRGLLHDLSKFGPTEFLSSAKYYTGVISPIDSEKTHKGYSLAWQHHKGHNPHHWEYWIDNLGSYENKPCRMPKEYIIEMVCDMLGAGIVYSKKKPSYNEPYRSPLDYYKRMKAEMILEKRTQDIVELMLAIIADEGINAFCKYARMFRKYGE